MHALFVPACFNPMHTVLTLLSYVVGYFVHVANYNIQY